MKRFRHKLYELSIIPLITVGYAFGGGVVGVFVAPLVEDFVHSELRERKFYPRSLADRPVNREVVLWEIGRKMHYKERILWYIKICGSVGVIMGGIGGFVKGCQFCESRNIRPIRSSYRRWRKKKRQTL